MSQPNSQELTLAETLRIMDVAAELRDHRGAAQRELEMDEVKRRLKDKLLATAKLTGETLEEADILAAVELYYDNLHAFREPPRGLATWFAHLYIRRGVVGLVALLLAFAGGIVWAVIAYGVGA